MPQSTLNELYAWTRVPPRRRVVIVKIVMQGSNEVMEHDVWVDPGISGQYSVFLQYAATRAGALTAAIHQLIRGMV